MPIGEVIESGLDTKYPIDFGRALGVGSNLIEDSAYKMIRARLRQIEVKNDPVLATILDMPIHQLLDGVKKRFDLPIQIGLEMKSTPDVGTRKEAQQSSEEAETEVDNLAMQPGQNAESVFAPPPKSFARKYNPSYTEETAQRIADIFPQAWQAFSETHESDSKWSASFICGFVPCDVATFSRYMTVFREYGIHSIRGINLPPPGNRYGARRKRISQ